MGKKVNDKLKLDVTRGQLEALMNITDDCSAMIGADGGQADQNRIERVKAIDKILKNNGLKRNYS